MSDFSGKHVVVTGATGGLGGAVVTALLDRGATCHLPIVEGAVPEGAVWAGHERARPATGIRLDDEAAVVAFYEGLPPIWASIHLVGGFTMGPFVDTPLADLQRMLSLNVTTCFLCSREAIRRMDGGGRIVNVAARPVLQPASQVAPYAASKAAVASLTACVAEEMREQGVLVNAVAPSIIDTPANRRAMPDADHDRWPKPAELASVIAWLASEANTVTSGSLVPVYGRA